MDAHDGKYFSGTTTSFGSREAYLEIIFKVFILSLLPKLVDTYLTRASLRALCVRRPVW